MKKYFQAFKRWLMMPHYLKPRISKAGRYWMCYCWDLNSGTGSAYIIGEIAHGVDPYKAFSAWRVRNPKLARDLSDGIVKKREFIQREENSSPR